MKPSPAATLIIAAFTVLVAVPLVGVIVHEIRMDAARERARIESQARLKLLAEQQRLRQVAAQFRERKPGPNPNQGTRR